jgi:hypothetical protein
LLLKLDKIVLETEMMSDDYLKCYADLYRVTKSADGVWCIATSHHARGGLTYDICVHSDGVLAACLPPKSAGSLMRKYGETFTIHQDAEDATVLLFEETRLHEMADVLRLRRRRKLSESHRKTLVESSTQFRFGFASKREKVV